MNIFIFSYESSIISTKAYRSSRESGIAYREVAFPLSNFAPAIVVGDLKILLASSHFPSSSNVGPRQLDDWRP